MFDSLIVQPIFNLLVFIYAVIPGHNFGLAIIVFTIVVRILLWPLVKKQLHNAKKIKALQPELKKIKAATKGNRQKESMMVMELYKEREISPFSNIGILIIQLIILIGLYQGLLRVVQDSSAVLTNSYDWINNLPWMQQLAADSSLFDATLFGVVDLTRAAIGPMPFYVPAFILVAGSALVQYYQTQQLMPKDKDAKKLKQILKEAQEGKQADPSEMNAAISGAMRYFIPVMIFVFTIGLASALSLYWFVGGLVAYIQQASVLKQDEEELEAVADKTVTATDRANNAIEAEIVEKPTKKKSAKSGSKKVKSKKRRK